MPEPRTTNLSHQSAFPLRTGMTLCAIDSPMSAFVASADHLDNTMNIGWVDVDDDDDDRDSATSTDEFVEMVLTEVEYRLLSKRRANA